MKIKSILIAACMLVALVSCKKQDQGSPGPNEIWMMYKTYNPTQLVIPAGTTVTFTNKDNSSHTATSTNGTFDSGTVKSGKNYTFTFNDKGTYYFYCNYHSSNSSEQGAILVK
jgi:plastocyanin